MTAIIEVKWITSTITLAGELQFKSIENVSATDVVSVYGDTFVSGFVDGSHFLGIINLKVSDRSQIESVRKCLEAKLRAPSRISNLTASLLPSVETSIFQGRRSAHSPTYTCRTWILS